MFLNVLECESLIFISVFIFLACKKFDIKLVFNIVKNFFFYGVILFYIFLYVLLLDLLDFFIVFMSVNFSFFFLVSDEVEIDVLSFIFDFKFMYNCVIIYRIDDSIV